jgi:hypothetical protein
MVENMSHSSLYFSPASFLLKIHYTCFHCFSSAWVMSDTATVEVRTRNVLNFHSIILIFHLHLCLATVEVRTRIVQTGHQSWVTVRMPAMAETLPCSPWARGLHTSSSSLTWRHQCTARSTETSVPAPCHPRQVKMPCSTISCEPSKMSELWVWKCGSGLTDEKFDQQAASSSSQPFYTFLPVGPVRRERAPSECKTDVSEGSVDLELKLWQGWMITTHTPCCCFLINNGTKYLVNNGLLWEKNVETCV